MKGKTNQERRAPYYPPQLLQDVRAAIMLKPYHRIFTAVDIYRWCKAEGSSITKGMIGKNAVVIGRLLGNPQVLTRGTYPLHLQEAGFDRKMNRLYQRGPISINTNTNTNTNTKP